MSGRRGGAEVAPRRPASSGRALAFALTACLGSAAARAQSPAPLPGGGTGAFVPGWGAPVEDDSIFVHGLFDQLEGRTSGSENRLRWDGQAWIGTDLNKLWIKSEGSFSNGKVSDGDHELLYDRPIPRLRYIDFQAGVRADLDSGPARLWGAVGVEGLSLYFFEFETTFYFSSGGHLAARLTGSYDLLITQRLILQPQLEMNAYSKDEPARGVGSGVSDLDTGLRLRYEFSRKFAPYIGFAYSTKFGETAALARQAGEIVRQPRFLFGVRAWY